jgi:hypothetical protein
MGSADVRASGYLIVTGLAGVAPRLDTGTAAARDDYRRGLRHLERLERFGIHGGKNEGGGANRRRSGEIGRLSE